MPDARRKASRAFCLALVAIAALGMAIQITYALSTRADVAVGYDGPQYSKNALLLAEGHGYLSSEDIFFKKVVRQTAIHPPLTSLWLSIPNLFGHGAFGDAIPKEHQIWLSVVGFGTILLVGAVGRELASERAGLLAAGLAAVHPGIWTYPTTVMSEPIGQFLFAAVLLLVYRFGRSPSLARAAWLGGVAGLLPLARSEQVLVFPLIVIPVLVWRGLQADRRTRMSWVAAATVWAGLVTGPYVVFNQLRFEEPVLLGTALDIALGSSNCQAAYHGNAEGYWSPLCRPVVEEFDAARGRYLDESEIFAVYREEGLADIEAESDRLPAVLVIRAQRALSLRSPENLARFEAGVEGRGYEALRWSFMAYYVLSGLTFAACWRLRRAGRHVLPLLMPFAIAALGGMSTHGTSRLRCAVEIVVVIGAGVQLDHLFGRVAELRRAPSPSEQVTATT